MKKISRGDPPCPDLRVHAQSVHEGRDLSNGREVSGNLGFSPIIGAAARITLLAIDRGFDAALGAAGFDSTPASAASMAIVIMLAADYTARAVTGLAPTEGEAPAGAGFARLLALAKRLAPIWTVAALTILLIARIATIPLLELGVAALSAVLTLAADATRDRYERIAGCLLERALSRFGGGATQACADTSVSEHRGAGVETNPFQASSAPGAPGMGLE